MNEDLKKKTSWEIDQLSYQNAQNRTFRVKDLPYLPSVLVTGFLPVAGRLLRMTLRSSTTATD